MNEAEFAVATILLTIIGGAVGAMLTKAPAWKGSLVGLCGIGALLLLYAGGVRNSWVNLLAGIIASGIAAGALNVSRFQLVGVLLAAFLGFMLGLAALQFMS